MTCGEYEDYKAVELARAIVDFDLGAAVREYLASRPQIYKEPGDFQDLLTYLGSERHLVEALPYCEIHLGAEGIIDPELECEHRERCWRMYSGGAGEPDWVMVECCSRCNMRFPQRTRPVTADEYYAAFPWAKGQPWDLFRQS